MDEIPHLEWSSSSWVDVPMALARLHAELPNGATVAVCFPKQDGTTPPTTDLIEGAGFQLDATGTPRPTRPAGQVLVRQHTLPDFVGPGMRALVCGLNPSVLSADVGFGYAGANNRFWAAALSSGLVHVARRPREGFEVDAVGMTDLVKRPTPRSHHLAAGEYRSGMVRLEHLAAWLEPAVVIFVGLEGWRAAVDRRAMAGWQTAGVGARPAYVMPSTSGANARTSLPELVEHLQRALAGP